MTAAQAGDGGAPARASTMFVANGREYLLDGTPVVVICIDGSEPGYHLAAMASGRMPWLADLLDGPSARGTSFPARCAMPALTNPNNVSIATGRPPSEHGISGNQFLDTARGDELPMTDPALMRIPTIFSAAQEAGLSVAVVTAKDKLRRLLGAGLDTRRATCFSAERADEATIGHVPATEAIGRARPDVYSAELSQFVLAAGVRLLATERPDLTYLSLSDFVQHKHAPGTQAANDFFAMIDGHAAQLDALGAVVVITADHGMSAKSDATGAPRVIFLEDVLPPGTHVVLPITDPYVRHHGALGSFADVHLPADVDAAAIADELRVRDGIEATFLRADAARALQLPEDRVGDVVVLARADTALGRSREFHDLSSLDAPLRSHGGFGEARIPFIVNRPLNDRLGTGPVHNYDAFHVGCTVVTQLG